jgi:hypothetical protein
LVETRRLVGTIEYNREGGVEGGQRGRKIQMINKKNPKKLTAQNK